MRKTKNILTIIGTTVAACALAIACTGCSGANDSNNQSADSNANQQQATNTDQEQDGSAAEQELALPAQLQITDFGWTITDDGYVNFALDIFNPNKYVEAEIPVITVKGMDDQNNVIFEESTEISAIKPLASYEMGYVANKGADGNQIGKDQIADVAISIDVADEDWAVYDANDDDITTEVNYAVANQNVVASDVDGVDMFQGQLAVLTDDGQAVNKLPDAVADSETIPTYVNIILYGLHGEIVAGYYDVYDVPLNGDVIDYSVYAFNAPEYNGYKVFVHPYDYTIG